MTYRELLIGIAIGALALAALALAFAVRAIVRRARAGRRRVWGGLIVRSALIIGLAAVGVASLANLPPPDLVNHPAPATADAIVAFAQTARDGDARTVVGISARDGATRWTRAINANVESLLSPSPSIALAVTSSGNVDGIYALRVTDGAVLWRYQAIMYMGPASVAVDDARIYALAPAVQAQSPGIEDVIALDLQTGALEWRAPLPVSVSQPRQLAAGDGLVFVVGEATDSGTALTPWMGVALRAADGAPQWTKAGETNPGAPGAQVRAVFVAQGFAIVVPAIGPVTALRERDGVTAWTGTPDPQQPDNPTQNFAATASSDMIYLISQPSRWGTGANGAPAQPPASLTAMAIGGTVRWRANASSASSAWSALTLSDGVLLSGSSVTAATGWAGYRPTGSLLTAYDAASGRVLWRDNTPPTGISWDLSLEISPWGGSGAAYLMGIQTDPYIQDRFQCVIFCPGVSWLYAVNVYTGAPWWRVRMGNVSLSHLVF